jgi:hypothetical protein
MRSPLPDRSPRTFSEEEMALLSTPSNELEEQTSSMSFDIERLVARLKGEKWQQVLQAHLYFDHVITALLNEELKNPAVMDAKRMSFSQKLQLVHALGLISVDIVPVVSIVNKLRNRLAHDLEAGIEDEEIANLKNALPKWFKKQVMNKGELDDPEALRNILVFVLTYLDGARQQNALRRLQQRKAHLNAARVLYHPDTKYVP